MKEKLVEKLFRSACTREELEVLFGLIRQDPSPPSPALIQRIWEEVQEYPQLKEELFERTFGNVLAKINATDQDRRQRQAPLRIPTSQYPMKMTRIIGIAASFLLIVAFGAWYAWPANNITTVQTAFGERQTLELSDGSVVELNANSQMSFDKEWPEDIQREIWLDGEAFFQVKRKPVTRQKMKVVTDDLTVEVLGTTFNVNSKGEKTSVYLEEGQVRLHLYSLDSVILMEPGDLVIYSEKTQQISRKRREKTELHTSWKDGVLIFKSSPLSEVLQEITEIYGVQFKVMNEKDNRRKLNFPLPIDELETTISILQKTVGIKIRKEGQMYIIS